MYIHFVFHPYQWNCKGFFPAQRGLRHGNPLSPFLVRNGREALSQMVEAAGLVNPISPMVLGQPREHLWLVICRWYLLFFFEMEVEQVKKVKTTLLCYEVVSGLKVNFFGWVNQCKSWWAGPLVPCIYYAVKNGISSYLGLPLSLCSTPKSMEFGHGES